MIDSETFCGTEMTFKITQGHRKFYCSTDHVVYLYYASTMQFLSEIINIRDDVFSLQFSDGFTLS